MEALEQSLQLSVLQVNYQLCEEVFSFDFPRSVANHFYQMVLNPIQRRESFHLFLLLGVLRLFQVNLSSQALIWGLVVCMETS